MDKQQSNAAFKQADQLFQEGHYAEALNLLQELDGAYPDQHRILYPTALCLAKLHRFNEALTICNRLVDEFHYAKAESLRNKLEKKLTPATVPEAANPAPQLDQIPDAQLDMGAIPDDLNPQMNPLPEDQSPLPPAPAVSSGPNWMGISVTALISVVIIALLGLLLAPLVMKGKNGGSNAPASTQTAQPQQQPQQQAQMENAWQTAVDNGLLPEVVTPFDTQTAEQEQLVNALKLGLKISEGLSVENNSNAKELYYAYLHYNALIKGLNPYLGNQEIDREFAWDTLHKAREAEALSNSLNRYGMPATGDGWVNEFDSSYSFSDFRWDGSYRLTPEEQDLAGQQAWQLAKNQVLTFDYDTTVNELESANKMARQTENEQFEEAMNKAAFAIAMPILAIVFIHYILMAFLIHKISDKVGDPSGCIAWIPFLQFIPLLSIAELHWIWLCTLFIPYFNIIFWAYVGIKVAQARGKFPLLGIVLPLPGLNILLLLYLALSD